MLEPTDFHTKYAMETVYKGRPISKKIIAGINPLWTA
jgi:hypothetical protein